MATFYWTVQFNSVPAPSALEVKLAQDGNGGPLPVGQSGSVPDTGQASPLSGAVSSPLQPSMEYLVSWVWDDGAGDLRGPVNAVFTTSTSVFTGVTAETVTLSDGQTARVTYAAARAETVTLSHSQDATVTTGPVVHTVARAESVALSDSQTGVLAGGVVNPPWANVVTLLHNDGSGVFTDSSGYQWPITNTSATHGTPAKFGDAAQLFPGYFSIDGTQPEFAFGTGDLTIELQLYYASPHTGLQHRAGRAPCGRFGLGIAAFGDLILHPPRWGSGRTGVPLTPNALHYVVVTRVHQWRRGPIWQNCSRYGYNGKSVHAATLNALRPDVLRTCQGDRHCRS